MPALTLPRVTRLLPADPRVFAGPPWTAHVLGLLGGAGLVRSLIHIVAPDSGARSIASIDTDVAGGRNNVALLAQWGGAQLLESGTVWAVLRRYRGLIPAMLAHVLAEQVLRVAIGRAKPLATARTPPGALSGLLAPVLAVVLGCSLTVRDETHRRGAQPSAAPRGEAPARA